MKLSLNELQIIDAALCNRHHVKHTEYKDALNRNDNTMAAIADVDDSDTLDVLFKIRHEIEDTHDTR